jgi:PAS domain S-box-containing protein
MNKHNIFYKSKFSILSLIIGILFWIIDAFLDAIFFYEESFINLVVLDVPAHEIYVRLTFLLGVSIFGYILHILVEKDKKTSENLNWKGQILSNVHDAVLATDMDLIINSWNKGAERIYGWKEEEVMEKKVTDLVDFNIKGINEESLKRYVLKRGVWEGEAVHFDKNGKRLYVYWTISTLLDSRSAAVGMVGVVKDITEKRTAEKELEEVHRRYRLITDTAKELIIIHDLQGNVLFANKSAKDLINEGNDNILEKNVIDFVAKEYIKELIERAQKRVEGFKNEEVYELDIINERGERISLEISSVAIRESGVANKILLVGRDIRKRKEFEFQLKESKEKFQKLFEDAYDAIFTIENSEISDCNNRALEVYGASRKEELIGKTPFELSPYYQTNGKLSREEAISYIKNALDGEPQRFYWVHQKLNGEDFHTEVSLSKIEIQNRNLLQAIVRDVSESVRAEKEIKKLNRMYAVLSQVNEALIRHEEEENLLQKICEIVIEYGKFKFAWIGMIDDETADVKISAKDGYEEGYLEEVLEHINSEEGSKLVDYLERRGYFFVNNIADDNFFADWKDSAISRGYKSFAAAALKRRGKVIGAINIYTEEPEFFDKDELRLLGEIGSDISFALEKIEINEEKNRVQEEIKKLSEAVAQNPVSVLIADIEGNVEYVNSRYLALGSFEKSDVIGKNFLDLELSASPAEKREEIWKTIINGDIWRGETRNVNSHGQIIWVNSNYSPIFNKSGEITHFLLLKEDISERKALEKSLIEAKERAENSDKLKSEFLAQVSHEIRTPINTILNYITLIRELYIESEDDELKSCFSGIDNASKRIIRTIDSILNMAELQTGSYNYKPKKIDLVNKILKPFIDEYRYSAKSGNLELNLKNKVEKPVVTGDEYSISQIFDNLISNALKYTKEGSVNVKIRETENNLIVDVEDTGIGIEEDFIPHLFDEFTQEEQGYTRKFEGNGLGLALVKRYCEINKADISVKSEKGKGSVFSVSFKKVIN